MNNLRILPVVGLAILASCRGGSDSQATDSPSEPDQTVLPSRESTPSESTFPTQASPGAHHVDGPVWLTLIPGSGAPGTTDPAGVRPLVWDAAATAAAPLTLNYQVDFTSRSGNIVLTSEHTAQIVMDSPLPIVEVPPDTAPGLYMATVVASVFSEGELQGEERASTCFYYLGSGRLRLVGLAEWDRGTDYGACGWNTDWGLPMCGGMGENPVPESGGTAFCPGDAVEGASCDGLPGGASFCCAHGGLLLTCNFDEYRVQSMCGGVAICGDGRQEFEEQCDDGNTEDNDACHNTCQFKCGDGTLDSDEECDDGNRTDNDLCSNSCQPAVCGDSIVQGYWQGAWPTSTWVGEQCDDGNAINTDECKNDCQFRCGDGRRNKLPNKEQCDDGNRINDDACSNECRSARCGDGLRQSSEGEYCDDGNTADGDCCSSTCALSPSTCGGRY